MLTVLGVRALQSAQNTPEMGHRRREVEGTAGSDPVYGGLRHVAGRFLRTPILNSPYEYPAQHWELDGEGQPTDRILDVRRRSDLITPVPKPKKRRRKPGQIEMVLGSEDGLSTAEQEYNPTPIINEIRTYVESWRSIPNPKDWQVTPETARLLQHWRHHHFQSIRPFFCQIEAVETAIWLTEVAASAASALRSLGRTSRANERPTPSCCASP